MAFDMMLGEIREKIGHDEEYIFSYIAGNQNFPLLNQIWESYYRDPKVTPAHANGIVHEIIALLEIVKIEKQTQVTLNRLLIFFSKAYTTNQNIRCISD